MITPVKFPPAVALSENPVIFGLKTNNNIISSGTKAKLVLHFSSVIYTGSGYQFSLTFGGNTYTFTMAVNPDDSGLQFPRATEGDDNLVWAGKIKEALYANFYISELYDISHTYNQVHLIAKKTGAAYNLTGANISVPGLNFAAYSGTDQQIRNFFKIFAQIKMGDAVIGEDSLPVDAAGTAYFDFSEYLRAELSSTFAFPENSQQLMIKRENCCKDYTVRYCEFYSEADIPLMHKMTQKGPFKALTGGLGSETLALYNRNNTNWYNQLGMNHMFLTWHPGQKKTSQFDIQKLYYLVHTALISHNVTHVNLYTGLNYTLNGASCNTTALKATLAASKGDVLEICCGYSRLGLDADASLLASGSTVKSYDVFLKDDAGNIISEIRNFVLDANHYENYRQFIFRNSFGAFETVRCTAVQSREAAYENTVIDHTRIFNFTERGGDSKKDKALEVAKYVVNTGWITKKELDWARELFLSKEVYEIKNGVLYSVVITSEAHALGKDNDTLQNAVFEYIYAYSDQHYSKGKVLKPGAPIVVILDNNGPTTVPAIPAVPAIPLPDGNPIFSSANNQQQQVILRT